MCRRWANVGPMVECYLGVGHVRAVTVGEQVIAVFSHWLIELFIAARPDPCGSQILPVHARRCKSAAAAR